MFTRIFIQSIHLHLFTSKPLSNLQEILLMKNTGKPVLQLPMFTNNSNCLSIRYGRMAALSNPQSVNQQPRNQHILTTKGNRSAIGSPADYLFTPGADEWGKKLPFTPGITRSLIFSDWKNHA